jgi:hypothetical protein
MASFHNKQWRTASAAPIVVVFFVIISSVSAAAGSGTMTVVPDSAAAAATGTEFAFTFRPMETMDSGELRLSVPAGWTAPQGAAGSAGYTTAAATGLMLASVKDAADSTLGWSAGNACANGLALDASEKHEGSASIRCANGNEGNNDRWYKNFSTENWSSYTDVGFWIRSDKAISNGNLRFAFDNNPNIASPIEQISFGQVIPANSWTYIVLPLGNKNRSAVQSMGFVIRSAQGLDNSIVRIDDILMGPGALLFSTDVASARFLRAASGQMLVVRYGSGGGANGATVPAAEGEYVFPVATRSSDAETMVSIDAQPVVSVSAGAEPPAPAAAVTPAVTTPPYASIQIRGNAFPGAEVTFLFQNAEGENEPVQSERVTSDSGSFSFMLNAVLPGVYAYGLRVEDAAHRQTPVRLYSLPVGPRSIQDLDILAAPTIELMQSTVPAGGKVVAVGTASPASFVHMYVNDREIAEPITSAADGSYRSVVDVSDMPQGRYAIRARQEKIGGKFSDFSVEKTVTVSALSNPETDLNGDGSVTVNDWSIFLASWQARQSGREEGVMPSVDLNADGRTDIGDFSIFMHAFHEPYAP